MILKYCIVCFFQDFERSSKCLLYGSMARMLEKILRMCTSSAWRRSSLSQDFYKNVTIREGSSILIKKIWIMRGLELITENSA